MGGGKLGSGELLTFLLAGLQADAPYWVALGRFSVTDNLLFFTELLSMPVVDLKGRRIGRVKDAAMVPLVHASRIDRLLVGGADAWLAIRFDQVHTISLAK